MPINTPTAFARGAFATSSATIYTVPASTTAIFTNLVVTNTAASAATFTMVFDSVAMFTAVAVPANSSLVIDLKQVMTTTKVVTALASAVTVNYHLSGVASV